MAMNENDKQVEPVVCLVGMKGSAFDTPKTKRAYTYAEQPGNTIAWKLGNALTRAARNSGGDNIDYGLNLLKQLEADGFGVFDLGAEYTHPAPAVAQGEPRFPFAGFDPNFCPGSNPENPQEAPAVANLSDAYHGAREDLAIWKKRALEAEELNRKFIADINGQTFMGEPAPAVAVNEQTLSELKNMVRAYVRLLESGKDRIESLGGECDPVDRMEASDSNLRTAKAAIAAAEKAKGGAHVPD